MQRIGRGRSRKGRMIELLNQQRTFNHNQQYQMDPTKYWSSVLFDWRRVSWMSKTTRKAATMRGSKRDSWLCHRLHWGMRMKCRLRIMQCCRAYWASNWKAVSADIATTDSEWVYDKLQRPLISSFCFVQTVCALFSSLYSCARTSKYHPCNAKIPQLYSCWIIFRVLCHLVGRFLRVISNDGSI